MRAKLLTFLLGLSVGALLGAWLGKFYWSVQLGRKLSVAMRLVQEVTLAKEVKRTSDAYLNASPEVAWFAVSNHVRELDEAKPIFARDRSPTNIIASLCLLDILRAEMLCHARMARLCEMKGDTTERTSQLNAALKIASMYKHLGGDFGLVTNEASVKEFTLRCDRERRFW